MKRKPEKSRPPLLRLTAAELAACHRRAECDLAAARIFQEPSKEVQAAYVLRLIAEVKERRAKP